MTVFTQKYDISEKPPFTEKSPFAKTRNAETRQDLTDAFARGDTENRKPLEPARMLMNALLKYRRVSIAGTPKAHTSAVNPT